MKLKEENKNKSILTTSYVLCNDSPITYVFYDEDGDWQLFGDEEITDDEDAYLVAVEEILELEPALRKLPDMQIGQSAVREKNSTRWTLINDNE